jgi:lipopolysaccharide exporter|tara:strand:- start:1040 stop:2302 length:1263 start_codon:yes stop_codon:yes gene_type:complete
LKENTFGKNVATLMMGTGAAQAITLLLAFIVTRLYSPEDFTTLEHYAMILSVLSVFSTFKMELAIVQADTDGKALALVKWCLRTTLIVSLLCLLIFVIFNSQIAALFQNEELGFYLYFIPLNLLLFGVFQVMVYWHHRNKLYKASSVSKVTFNATNELSKISFGWLGITPGGLIFGNLLGRLASILAFFRTLGPNFKIKGVSNSDMANASEEYSEYYRFSVWGSFLAKLAAWAHIFLFTYFFGLWSIGFFALSRRLVLGPLNIFSQSFAQVFYQQISEMKDNQDIRRLFFKFFFRLVGIAGLMIAVVMLVPNSFYTFVLGDKWGELGSFIKLLIFWFGLNFVTSCLAFINYRLKKQKQMLFLDSLHLVIVVSSICFGFFNGYSEWETLQWFVLGKILFFLINIGAMVYFVLASSKLRVNE